VLTSTQPDGTGVACQPGTVCGAGAVQLAGSGLDRSTNGQTGC